MSDVDLAYFDSLTLHELFEFERAAPNDVNLLLQIGRRLFKSRQFGKCCDYYVRALRIDPHDGWAHLFFGNLLYALNCHSDAITHFRYAADFLPDVACPHWCLGDVLRADGDFTRAESHYRKAVDMDPDDLRARQKLNDCINERIGSE